MRVAFWRNLLNLEEQRSKNHKNKSFPKVYSKIIAEFIQPVGSIKPMISDLAR